MYFLGGWTSDDDSCPSSEYESQSRESSAGSSRGRGTQRRNRPGAQLPPVPTPRTALNRDHYSQQLTVDIPFSCKYDGGKVLALHSTVAGFLGLPPDVGILGLSPDVIAYIHLKHTHLLPFHIVIPRK